MSVLTREIRRTEPWRLADLLDTRIHVGYQYGAPIETTVREVLRQVPCLLAMGGLVALALFI